MTIIAVTTKGDNATDNAIAIEYADLESNDADAWNGELSASSTGRIQQTVQGARIRWSMAEEDIPCISPEKRSMLRGVISG